MCRKAVLIALSSGDISFTYFVNDILCSNAILDSIPFMLEYRENSKAKAKGWISVQDIHFDYDELQLIGF